MTEAETGMTQLQARERLGLLVTPRSWKRQGSSFPESLERERGLADTLIFNFWPPGLDEPARAGLGPAGPRRLLRSQG